MSEEIKNNVKFSVIIPCYNRETLVVRTITSVLRQTYTNFEIIVVDDASTDNSVNVVTQTFDDPRIQTIVLEKNEGVHGARNQGIDRATGDYLVFLDSDDELSVDALDSFYKVAITNSAISIISAPYLDDDGRETGLTLAVSGYVAYEDLLSMRVSKKNKAGLTCVSKKLLGNIRFVAPNLDYIFYRYLMRKGTTYYIARPLGLYHLVASAGSLNYERKLPKPHLSVKRAVAIDAFLVDFKNDLKKHCPELLSGYSYGASVGLLLAGKQKRAIIRSFDAMRYSHFSLNYTLFFLLTILPFASSILWLFFWMRVRYTTWHNHKLHGAT